MSRDKTLVQQQKTGTEATPSFEIELERLQDFEFRVAFDWSHLPGILVDEPEPLGQRRGPNASRLLAAAVGSCLAASLLFCLRKSHIEPRGIAARVRGQLARDERGYWRIAKFDAELTLDADVRTERLERCLSLFEDYCVVTASVRRGIPVGVRVVQAEGRLLYRSPEAGSRAT